MHVEERLLFCDPLIASDVCTSGHIRAEDLPSVSERAAFLTLVSINESAREVRIFRNLLPEVYALAARVKKK